MGIAEHFGSISLFLLTKPNDQEIEQFRSAASATALTYDFQGATRDESEPRGYTVDRYRITLGHGSASFEKAVQAVQAWKMFDLGWVELISSKPPTPDHVVVIRCSHLGFYSLHACRVLYVIDERDSTGFSGVPFAGPNTISFGFAYGTLKEHAESGEERFIVTWNQLHDWVSYDILAFSRPNGLASRLAYPFTRVLQLRFGRHSKRSMQRAVVS
jgi:uncharacterized protein (UPF0548 family)